MAAASAAVGSAATMTAAVEVLLLGRKITKA